MKYVPISFKSDYSLLKSLLKVGDIVKYAKDVQMNYVGILDDNPYGIMDFYEKCEKANLKCIFGMTLKVGESKIYLYIRDYIGYLNLIKINSLKNDNKFTFNDLSKYNEGLIAVLPFENYNLYNRFKNVLDIYLGYRNQAERVKALSISKKVIFLNEILAFKREDARLLDILYKIAGSIFEGTDFYIGNASLEDVNTIEEFVSRVDFKLPSNDRYIPVFKDNKDESRKYLNALAVNGLKKRLNGNISRQYQDRLKHELDIIESMGFVDYFLIVYDYVKFARKNGIIANPRGSAAGSLVSYSLGITEVDPIKYDLLFERFLNPERVTMPDIDMDFEDTRRSEVIDYVKRKYGDSNVALIVAYATLGSKQVIRDVSKVFDLDGKFVDALSKKIDGKKSLRENLKDESLVDFIKANKCETMYKICMRLEGIKKHTTIHAAGVVISSEPLVNVVPTIRTPDGILTGFTMEYLERLGLLKMDFLGLRNLTMMHNMIKLVAKRNPGFDIKKIPFDDAKTYKVFQMADTDNVFQFESAGMKNFLKKLHPTSLSDLIAANALFRPGPMKNIDEYVARRKGEKQVSYPHPDLEPILKSTYGIIIYQEQIMQILSKMGGYTFAQADLVRRAMSKKKHDVMEAEKAKFISGAITHGYEEKTAIEVYDLIVRFADYGFNKSHSVAYAIIGYQMAYLKANYRDVFDENNLNMKIGGTKTIKEIIEDAKNRGLTVVKPDINKSSYEYVINDGKVILPLTCIKDITSNVSKTVIDNAPYDNYFDFFRKVYSNSINRKVVETLIMAGALDSLGLSKNTMLENIDSAITYLELVKNLDVSLVMEPDIIISDKPDSPISEIELFGFYISGHPSSKFDEANIVKIRNLKKFKDKTVTMGLLVDRLKPINTKKGERMAFMDVSDDTGSASAVIFPKNNTLIDRIEEGELVLIRAMISLRGEELQIIVNELLDDTKKTGF